MRLSIKIQEMKVGSLDTRRKLCRLLNSELILANKVVKLPLLLTSANPALKG